MRNTYIQKCNLIFLFFDRFELKSSWIEFTHTKALLGVGHSQRELISAKNLDIIWY